MAFSMRKTRTPFVTPTARSRSRLAAALLALIATPALAADAAVPAPHWLWILPFVLILASIALVPFINKHWWERWYPAVAVGLGAISAAYYLVLARQPGIWLGEMEDYVSFIALLGSLFIISGGIVIHVGRKATPLANCALLLIGAVIANIFGTTGASMLLIRPYLRMNKGHIQPYHVVFFIFLVSNVGGSLTPIGDPPLFLGYLQGVPFWWVLEHCRAAWLLTVGLLLAVFFVIDTLEHGRSKRHSPDDPGPAVSIIGIHNLLFISVVLAGVFKPGLFDLIRDIRIEGFRAALAGQMLVSREVLMLAATIGSRLLTSRAIYEKNEFTYAPIKEVAILFVGIFSTMTPALHWLHANAAELPLHTPGQYYFASGSLSSILDNAPTYLTFLQVELGQLDRESIDRVENAVQSLKGAKNLDIPDSLAEEEQLAMQAAIKYHADAIRLGTISRREIHVSFLLGNEKLNSFIVAISLGAVFFGAMTYIGNGPNFMVKSIADASGSHCPSFVGYIIKYSLPILVPIFAAVWFIFLRT
jgi:Na+/H+ antiporter NhaD/arsenite permease-like protein